MQYFVFVVGVFLLGTGCLLSSKAPVVKSDSSQPLETLTQRPAQESLGDIANGKWVTSQLAVGGQPSQADVQLLRDAGVELVINLRRPSEMSFDERAYLTEMGIRYAEFPIGGVSDFYQEIPAQPELGLPAGSVLEQIDALLKAFLVDDHASAEPLRVLVHCASGNRVGAVFALMAYELDQMSIDAALEQGRAHGLTGLYGPVREVLMRQEKTLE